MSSRDLPALILEVSHRRADRWCAVAVIALALVSSSLAAASHPAIGLCLALLAAASLSVGLWRARWFGRRRLSRVAWLPDGRWLLADRDGQWVEGRLRGDSRFGSHYVWLRWDADIVQSMLLFCGDLTEPDMRRLIVRLRIEGLPGPLETPG